MLANDERLRTRAVFHGGNIIVTRGSLPSDLNQADSIDASALSIVIDEDLNSNLSDRKNIAERLQA